MQPSQTDFGEKDEDTWCSRPLKIDKNSLEFHSHSAGSSELNLNDISKLYDAGN